MQIASGRFLKPLHYLKILFLHKFLGYPYLAVIETTNTCNINCPTCPTPRHKLGRNPRIMTLDEFKKIIDNIKDSAHIVLLYNTNEPLLHPNLTEMIKYCDKNNLYTMISTNSTLLNKEKADELLNAGLDEILLCLDGTSKTSYEEFRKGANFETVAKNINYFCKEKQRRNIVRPYVELQFILHKLNQEQIPEIKKWAKIWKVDRLHIKSFSLCEYAYSRDEIKNLSEKFLPQKTNNKQYNSKIIFERQGEELRLQRKNKNCSLAKNQAVILADGNLVMCCYDIKGQFSYGSVLEQSLKKIWFDDQNRRRRKLAEEKTYPLCKICGEY